MSSNTLQPSYAPLNNIDEIKQHIYSSKVRLLYEQLPLGILSEALIFLILVLGFYSQSTHGYMLIWAIYMLGVLFAWSLLWALHGYIKTSWGEQSWVSIFAVCAFFSGLGWGLIVSVLMPDNILHQAFIIIIIIGITAGTIPLFSPIFFIYPLFLFATLGPLIFWLFYQGELYVLLGYCAIVYLGVVLMSCYYSNKFLTTALALRYKNLNLDSLNQLLENKIAERTGELAKSLAITKSTLEATADGIMVVDLLGQLEYYNQKFLSMWKLVFPDEPTPNLKLFFKEILKQLTNPEMFLHLISRLMAHLEEEACEEMALKNGQIFEWHSKPYRIGENIVGRVWTFHDITKRKQMEELLSYQANHDMLTGLPNRKLLYDRLIHAIHTAKRHHTKLILLFLDIDNFKLINDTLGHDAGDLLLEQTGKRLKSCARESDTVSRFGGDEFVIVYLTNSYDEATTLCQRVLSAINRPIHLGHQDIVVTANIGISLYPKDGIDAATLLKNADLAMFQAKNKGKNNFQLYEESIRNIARQNLKLQIELRNALNNEEFYLVYQPTMNLKTEKIMGIEALLRWQHPQKGLIYPDEFIQVAEESGLIIPLGQWVFSEACRQISEWRNTFKLNITIAINVSGVQFRQEDFIQCIEHCIEQHQLPPEIIEIELTESVIMNNKQQNLQILQQLHAKGIKLTIDDFGTGYSSLSYLRDFPVSKLKIAQPFITNCPHDVHNTSIVEAIIAMGHGLKMQVLAEGIENEEQFTFLRQQGCDEGQGFYLSEPLSAMKFTELLGNSSFF